MNRSIDSANSEMGSFMSPFWRRYASFARTVPPPLPPSHEKYGFQVCHFRHYVDLWVKMCHSRVIVSPEAAVLAILSLLTVGGMTACLVIGGLLWYVARRVQASEDVELRLDVLEDAYKKLRG